MGFPGSAASLNARVRPLAAAVLCCAGLAWVLTAPALGGRAALGPDVVLDSDPLYRTAMTPALPTTLDTTPILLDYPRDLAFAHGLREGRLDAWNPLVAGGTPLWGEQGGPFFPLKLVFYAAPSRETYNAFLALRLVAAGVGAYLLARRRGLLPAAAIAAGATFQLSGALLALLPFGSFSAPYLLPWVLLASFTIAEQTSLSATLGAALVLGITASAGHPTTIFMVFAAFAVAIAGHMAASWRRPRLALRISMLGVVAVCLGLTLAAPALLPLAELTTVGITYKDKPIGALWRSFELGHSRHSFSAAVSGLDLLGPPGASSGDSPLAVALGGLVVFAVLAGVAARRMNGALVGVAILGLGLALALAGLGWLGHLPGFRLILPIYAWPLVSVVVAQGIGDGIDTLSGPRARLWGSTALAGMLAGLVVLYLHPLVPDRGPALTVLALGVALAVFSLCARLGGTRFAAVWASGLTALIVFGRVMATASSTLQPPSTVLGARPSPAVAFLQTRLASGQARFTGLPGHVGFPWSPMLFALRDLRNTSALMIRRYVDYSHAIHPGAGGFVFVWPPVATSPLLDLAAVRYSVFESPLLAARYEAFGVKAPERPADDDPTIPLVYRDPYVVVHENRAALPRVRIVHRSANLRGEDAAREWTKTLGARTEHARELGLGETVVLEPDEHGRPAPILDGRGPSPEDVRLVNDDDPDRLLVQVSIDQPGFVVIADTYYPGWKAWVDGTPASIYPAYLLFRAIYVPAGSHEVELRYQPSSLRYGGLIAALAAAACIGTLAARRLRHRVRPALRPRSTSASLLPARRTG